MNKVHPILSRFPPAHRLVKVHVVRDDLDVGVEDTCLADHLFQHVPQPRREDEQGDSVLVEAVEELLVAFPVEPPSYCRSPFIIIIIIKICTKQTFGNFQ